MKYYKIDFKSGFPEEDRVLGHANGGLVPNGRLYFDRMGQGEIIRDAPVFDYFHLQSFGPKEEWEWRLQDVHGFIGEYPTGGNWYISDRFKKLLEKFNIANGYHFYATKLLYKGEKLDYWIFQFPVNPLQNFDYVKSEYSIEGQSERLTGIQNQRDYEAFDYKLYKETKKDIVWKKTVFIRPFDMIMSMNDGRLVSEALKNAIEKAGLEGLVFEELKDDIEISESV